MREQEDYWEYVCVWVDDILVISRNLKKILDILEKEHTLKGVGYPEYYLGADMKDLRAPENVFRMGSLTYIKRCLTVNE